MPAPKNVYVPQKSERVDPCAFSKFLSIFIVFFLIFKFQQFASNFPKIFIVNFINKMIDSKKFFLEFFSGNSQVLYIFLLFYH